jgi:hypothetical protein
VGYVRRVATARRGDDLVVVHGAQHVDRDLGVLLVEVGHDPLDDAQLAIAEARPEGDRDRLAVVLGGRLPAGRVVVTAHASRCTEPDRTGEKNDDRAPEPHPDRLSGPPPSPKII